jgi:predicted nucleic acid-binding protein
VKVLFDTSVLVAATVESHPGHGRALPWLQRAKKRDFEFLVASHTLAELYAVLTSLPLRPRISPETARRLVRENVGSCARIVSLSASDYRTTIDRLAGLGITGGVVYDALIARAALKARAEKLLTLNIADFEQVWPEGQAGLTLP